jgi:preprotein translocase subunit YajC
VGELGGLLPLLLAGVVLYLLIIRPSRTRQRRQAQVVADAQPGAQIRTIGGIYGRIVDRDEQRIRLEVAPGVIIEFIASAIAEIIPPDIEPELEPQPRVEGE